MCTCAQSSQLSTILQQMFSLKQFYGGFFRVIKLQCVVLQKIPVNFVHQ